MTTTTPPDARNALAELPIGHATPDFIADYFDKEADQRDQLSEHFNPDLTDYMREAARLLRKAYIPDELEIGLTVEDQRKQASRCSCNGTDDYCPCQNFPDAATRRLREAVKIALDCGSLPIKEGRELEAALIAAAPQPTDKDRIAALEAQVEGMRELETRMRDAGLPGFADHIRRIIGDRAALQSSETTGEK